MAVEYGRLILRCDHLKCKSSVTGFADESKEDLRIRANENPPGWNCDPSGYGGDFCHKHRSEKRFTIH